MGIGEMGTFWGGSIEKWEMDVFSKGLTRLQRRLQVNRIILAQQICKSKGTLALSNKVKCITTSTFASSTSFPTSLKPHLQPFCWSPPTGHLSTLQSLQSTQSTNLRDEPDLRAEPAKFRREFLGSFWGSDNAGFLC